MDVRNFDDLNLSPGVLATIKELGFDKLTPVQASCIPLFLSKKDVAVEAVTGSGKTLSFLVPIFELLLKTGPYKKHDVGAIVISPTRELAAQTAEIVKKFLKHIPQFTSMLVIGGKKLSKDAEFFLENGANIIVATPGRLADLLAIKSESKLTTYVKNLEILVLDEADRLLEVGFERTINPILQHLPKQRQTGLFSATQTKEMDDIIRAGMRNPICICVKEKGTSQNAIQKIPATLSNFYMVCEADGKFSTLLWFLTTQAESKCIVFFSTCAQVAYFSYVLKNLIRDVPVISIHGKMKRNREKIFQNFKTFERGILVCTDLMARGVDIPDVEWVVQFDPPGAASCFVHRCGRTARNGRTGNALVMLLPSEDIYVNFLNIHLKVKLEKMKTPSEKKIISKLKNMFENCSKPISTIADITSELRDRCKRNREMFETGLRAFVSYIRFYSKHECNQLFRVKDLDLGKLANGYALIKLPIMPELKKKTPDNFKPMDVDFDAIPYLDMQREKQRQITLLEFKENPMSKRKIPVKKLERLKAKKMEAKKQIAKKRKKRRIQLSQQDHEELARDASLCRKYKRKKISEEEFNEQFVIGME